MKKKTQTQAFANLVASILLLRRFGTAGIFMGTITSTLLACAWVEVWIVYRNMLHTGVGLYIRRYLEYLLSTGAVGMLVHVAVGALSGTGVLRFALQAVVCLALVMALFSLLYWRNRHFVYFRNLVFTLFREGARCLTKAIHRNEP